jgi:hypothetical protein
MICENDERFSHGVFRLKRKDNIREGEEEN